MRVHTIHCDTVLWSSSLTVSNKALYIHIRALELSAKDMIYDPGPSCCIIGYIDVADARNYSNFFAKMPWNSGGMC